MSQDALEVATGKPRPPEHDVSRDYPAVRSWRWLIGGHLVLAAAAMTAPVRAQCGATTSSCRQCHEIEGTAMRPASADWHTHHALGDFCVQCHGGDGTARSEAPAHASLTDPLDDPARTCGACHDEWKGAASAYRGARERRRSGSRPPPPAGVESRNGRARDPNRTNLALAVLVVLVALGGGTVVANDKARSHLPSMSPSRALRAPGWSPYAAGSLLGVAVAISLAVFGHRLSGGGAYQQVAAPLGRALAPRSVYFTQVLSGAATWELAGLLGALLGAFASARLSRSFRWRTMPDSGWTELHGPSVKKRWTIGFAGAALTQVAAGIAGGCTASLAISGGAALAPGAFVFMMGMFAGGIPTAWLISKRGRS